MDMNKYYVEMPIYGTVDIYKHKADPLINYDAIAPSETIHVLKRDGNPVKQFIKGILRHGNDWLHRTAAPEE